MNEEFLQLSAENEELKKENERLVKMLEDCHKTLDEQIAILSSVKVEMRRYEVQLNTLKSENADLKNKFARLETNPIGRILFKLYRNLREIKHRIKG